MNKTYDGFIENFSKIPEIDKEQNYTELINILFNMYKLYHCEPRYENWNRLKVPRGRGTTTTILEWLKYIQNTSVAIVVSDYRRSQEIQNSYGVMAYYWRQSLPRNHFLIFDNALGPQEAKSQCIRNDYSYTLQTSKFILELYQWA